MQAALPAAATPAPAQALAERTTDAGPDVFDPSLRSRKRKPGLNLFQMGAVPHEHQQVVEAKAADDAARAAAVAAGLVVADASGKVPLVMERIVPVPDMEWWDALIYDQSSYAPGPDGRVPLRDAKITALVEHPVAIEPPAEAPPPPPQALKLTKAEMKKIRRQRREEREKERQLNIQVGLLEPPKDKVRLSNMARVYGADGVVDATAIELKVREAAAERQAAHDDRNLARKLTTAERKAKKLRKMFDDEAPEIIVHVFRIRRLDDGRAIYKVDVNAIENRLSGACVCVDGGVAVVIVEGERKGVRRFNRLMLHRIDWNPMATVEGADESMFEELNKCCLVWQGVVAAGSFEGFKRHKFTSEGDARQFLASLGAVQYWDAAMTVDDNGIDDVAI